MTLNNHRSVISFLCQIHACWVSVQHADIIKNAIFTHFLFSIHSWVVLWQIFFVILRVQTFFLNPSHCVCLLFAQNISVCGDINVDKPLLSCHYYKQKLLWTDLQVLCPAASCVRSYCHVQAMPLSSILWSSRMCPIRRLSVSTIAIILPGRQSMPLPFILYTVRPIWWIGVR